ncbi:MAG: SpoIIE family protein phosphatase [bacterium]|nr:SpoIIE family protein phosphatase [bacterium]
MIRFYNIKIKLTLFAIILLSSYSYVHSTEPVVLDRKTLSGSKIGKYIEFYEDKERALRIDDVISKEIKLAYEPSKKDSPGFGYSKSHFWLRFSVENPTKTMKGWYLEIAYPLLDSITLYTPNDENTYQPRYAGDTIPYGEREFDYEKFIFRMKGKPGKSTYYLMVKSNGPLTVPINIWSSEQLNGSISNDQMVMGIYYGIMLVMLVYNLFVFFATRDFHYLYYVFFIGTFVLVVISLNGHGFRYLWPNTLWLCNGTPFIMALTNVAAILFSRSYLSVPKQAPVINRILLGVVALDTAMIFLSFALPYQISIKLMISFQVFGTVLLIVIGVIFLFRKSREAVYFLAAWFLMLLGSTFAVLRGAGILPVSFFSLWGMQIGSSLQMVIFSLGLADKINVMKNDLKSLNENLEIKVRDRTNDLLLANKELTQVNTSLTETKEALWGEMQFAKKIQTVLLPEKPFMKGYEISAYMKPADDVGGDYYDIINVKGLDWIVIGDVSGHGVPAGLIMMMVQTAIHTVLEGTSNIKPSALLARINKVITNNIKKLDEDKYMTITVIAAMKGGRMHFSGLHQDIMIFRAETGNVEPVETSGMWIGLMEDIKLMVNDDQISLYTGDTMLVFTDGITEAWLKGSVKDERNPEEEMFGEKRLRRILEKQGANHPDIIKKHILDELEGYSCNDDVTMVIIRKTG